MAAAVVAAALATALAVVLGTGTAHSREPGSPLGDGDCEGGSRLRRPPFPDDREPEGTGTRRALGRRLVPQLRRAFRRFPTFFAFYVGNRDVRFRAENERLAAELTQARVPHLFRLYPGAHEQALWTAHARAWLALAIRHLARPRG
jgi:acetyl esterase/lipase